MPTTFDTHTLETTAREMTAAGKGILAADESTGTITKRLAAVGVESTEPNRRAYRELLFTASGLGEHIAGVILFDETIRQSTADGHPFPEVLHKQGVVAGIKVDRGTVPLAGFPGETVTEGLDGLRPRLGEYRELGARFAKWRAVIHVGSRIPTSAGIEANAHLLARYAALCQEAGLVADRRTRGPHGRRPHPRSLRRGHLRRPGHRVPAARRGASASGGHDPQTEHGHLRREVPRPGDAGGDRRGDGPDDAPVRAGRRPRHRLPLGRPDRGQATRTGRDQAPLGAPWALTFSYGRALQKSVLRAWRGAPENAAEAQRILLERARADGLAREGTYTQ